jgi:endo-1,4-beta-xylanase
MSTPVEPFEAPAEQGTPSGPSRRNLLLGAGAGVLGAAVATTPLGSATAAPAAAGKPKHRLGVHVPPLWKAAAGNSLVYGSSIAAWQVWDDTLKHKTDPGYAKLHPHHAALLFPEDDLLWYRIRPTPKTSTSELDFRYSDRMYRFAEAHNQIVYAGPGLVWDDGFGDGWTDDDLWGISEKRARHLLYDTLRAVMKRYKGRTAVWPVVNEAIVNGTDQGHHGLRKDVPWFNTIGPEYVHHAFFEARDADPHGMLILNDFGYETVNQYGDRPIDKMRKTLKVIDDLQRKHVPLDGFGVQAHLAAQDFGRLFHAHQYRTFLRELGDRGLHVLITEMDVLDDGLPKAPGPRDRMIADVYRRYLDVALESHYVKAVISFGLTDRYTWLDEDTPRDDGAHRRPLAFDRNLRTKLQYHAIHDKLAQAPRRPQPLHPKRHLHG